MGTAQRHRRTENNLIIGRTCSTAKVYRDSEDRRRQKPPGYRQLDPAYLLLGRLEDRTSLTPLRNYTLCRIRTQRTTLSTNCLRRLLSKVDQY